LVKHDSPVFPFASPNRTTKRVWCPISGKGNIGGDGKNGKICDLDGDARRRQHLADHIAFRIDTARASEFDELIGDETIKRVGGCSDFRT